MPRNASGLAEADSYRPKLLTEEEPRYLRRQKPVEIRRKKFGGQELVLLSPRCDFERGRELLSIAAVIEGVRFLLYSPQFALLKPDQIDLTGNHIVSARGGTPTIFARPQSQRAAAFRSTSAAAHWKQLPWVESASVQRILPNRIRVEITERTPIAFLRNGNELASDRCARRHSRPPCAAKTSIFPSSPASPKNCRATNAKSACRSIRNS